MLGPKSWKSMKWYPSEDLYIVYFIAQKHRKQENHWHFIFHEFFWRYSLKSIFVGGNQIYPFQAWQQPAEAVIWIDTYDTPNSWWPEKLYRSFLHPTYGAKHMSHYIFWYYWWVWIHFLRNFTLSPWNLKNFIL